jgi:hypothetical protein
MTNALIWQRANGRAAMILFWGLVSAYTYVKYFIN